MGPLVRVVCIDCLQSIEVSVSGSMSEPESCPHCGCYLDPFNQGVRSSSEMFDNSLPTLDLSDVSTLETDNPFLGPVRKVGRFEIRVTLGEGGYGQVYRAYDPHLEREVALKVLKPNRLGQKALERFYREARAAARLDHPNIVALHDAGRDEGRCWIAYQLVSGRTLSAVRDLAPPSIIESIRLVRDLALALDHAHGRGVFHRDIKPANVMIDEAGRPRLTDFGLARRDDIESDLTTEGTVLGTPQYMSPEAAAGRAHQADARSDVYSLGVILYELLCGRRPCDVPSGAPIWRSTHYSTPPTPKSVDRAIPQSLDRICMKALAFNPADRYANAGLLADALNEQIDNYRPAHTRRSIHSIAQKLRPQVRRFGGLAIASTVCLVAVATVMLMVQPMISTVTPITVPPSTPGTESPLSVVSPPVLEAAPPSPRGSTGGELGPVLRRSNGPKDPLVQSSGAVGSSEVDPSGTAPIVGNKDSNRYHVRGCRSMPKLQNRVGYASVAQAEAQGLQPCSHCRKFLDTPEQPAPAP